MYLETMQNVLSDTEKVIVDGGVMDNGVQGAIPYVPLTELRRGSVSGPASGAAQ